MARTTMTLCLLLALGAGVSGRAAEVCNLGDPAVIGAFTSGDCDLSVAEGPTPGSHALGVVYRPVNDWPHARNQLPVEQDWTGASELVVTARNDSPATATIEVGITDAEGHIYKPARRLGPGTWAALRVPVRFSKIELVTYPQLAAPKARASGARDGVALNWEAVPGARAYEIYRRVRGSREVRLARFPQPRFVDTEAPRGVRCGSGWRG